MMNSTPTFRILPDGLQKVFLDESVLSLQNISKSSNHLQKEEDKSGTTYWNISDMSTVHPLVPEPPLYIMICVSIIYIAIFIME